MSRYPEAMISVDRRTSRQAVQALFAAECDLAILSRELDPDERRAATEGGLEVEGYRFARGGLVFLVHETNPVQNLALEDVRRIYRGEWRDWQETGGGRGRIVPVIQELNSDVTEAFLERVMMGEPIRAAVRTVPSDSAAVAAVQADAGAIAFVGLAAPRGTTRALRLANLRGLPYVLPDPEAIHGDQYPLSLAFYAYTRAEGARLANGFITHLTSMEGQRLVRDLALVPANVPVRFVRRSPMLSTHSRGDSTNTP